MRYIRLLSLVIYLSLAIVSSTAWSQVESVQPRSLKPGVTSELIIRGKNLTPPLRIDSSLPKNASLELQSIDPDSAKLTVTLPENSPLGPAGLWIATAAGNGGSTIVIVDDLPSSSTTADNHTFESAQLIEPLIAIEGLSDGGNSDFFKFNAQAGQRIGFQILTQQLHSTMDPVAVLYDAQGNVLHREDDSIAGPDIAFEHQFAIDGTFFLEIHDSRYAAGGTYYLRIGDFPLLKGPQPLAIHSGSTPEFTFANADPNINLQIHTSHLTDISKTGPTTISARTETSKSSQWFRAWSTDRSVFMESQEAAQSALTIPSVVSGQLQKIEEEDVYSIKATKGQTLRISALTRSLDCPTLLRMRLSNAAGATVAETPVNAADEWSFDYAVPEDGAYDLSVHDLLKRGGEEFSYVILIDSAPAITIAMKPDAATEQAFPIEVISQDGAQVGACAIPIQIGRFGYDGPIDLTLVDAPPGLSILNPQIPASVGEALIYIHCSEQFVADAHRSVTLSAASAIDPSIKASLSSLALQRIKIPHVPFPYQWNDGRFSLTSVAATDPWFSLDAATPLSFATHARQHTATLNIKRLQDVFKTPVTLLPQKLPVGWSMQSKLEGDVFTVTFDSPEPTTPPPNELTLLAFAQHAGRGRIAEFTLPIDWYRPVDPQMEIAQSLIAGSTVEARLMLNRNGSGAQPASVHLIDLPSGIKGPAEPVAVAAEANEIVIQLTISPELTAVAVAVADAVIKFEITGQHSGAEYKVSGQSSPFQIIPIPQRIAVYPETILLNGSRDRQRVVVTGSSQQTNTRDWTRDVSLASTDPAIAEVRNGVIYPLSNGSTEIVVQLGPLKHHIPVQVTSAEHARPIQFENEVLVALSKQGCNSGACHGSPSGKGGFRLSLRAFDKKLDQLTLLREDFGRRINAAEPVKSLLLEKPLMKVSHGGGKQIRETDEAYTILKNWISEGAQSDPADTARCVQLDVFPGEKTVLDLSSGSLQLAATARFADGTSRDVTHLVAYESTNNNVATVNADGFVEAKQRGEAVILVRYLEHIHSVPLMFVDSIEGFQWETPPENNYIDRLVNEKLAKLQYLPAPTCTDSEFIRRAYLDVIGILPTLEETESFLADPSPEKRATLIDALLDREEYAKFWALKWGDLLKTTSKLLGDDGVYKYHRWVENAFQDNMPYDQFAQHLLTASGSTLANPPANFYRTANDMNESVENISQVFLGARLQCAKCHNHPFEHWTQDNYYGLGAFFQRVQRRSTQRPGEMFIWYADAGEVTQPRTGQQMKPWLPERGSIETEAGFDRRLAFAEWLIDPENPFFAKIEANRIWSQLFARGIVDPIDDFRDSNPPTNESLLEALAKDFAASGYDRKHLLRTILNSRTYQASFQTNPLNEGETLYFSHQIPRLLSAEQLLDAVNQVTGITQTFGHLPCDTLATQLPAPDIVKVDFLRTFGQPERTTVCECEREDESNLGMAIELFNGSVIHEKLTNPNNRFRKSLAAGKTIPQIIDELYMTALCRQPTAEELSAAINHCDASSNPEVGLEDICWALLNRDEFLFQH